MRWVTSDIAAAVGGELTGDDVAVDRVTQDSREIDRSLGDWLFVPLIAARDGHDFVPGAIAAGAVATLASRPVDSAGATVVRVDSTDQALLALGTAARNRLDDAAVVGITGSVGKTTTKDLLAAVLREDRSTHANIRSFNNEIGVPLTLLGAPEGTEAVVLEMGARGVGHIRMLCEIGRPTLSIVTTVGAAHTSEFGSVDAVAVGKREIVESLPAAADGGVAVLNADNPLVAAMAAHTDARVVTFGADADVRATDVRLGDDLAPSFRLVAAEGEIDVSLGGRGVHLVDNALAAAAAALALGVPIASVASGLARPQMSPNRMAVHTTASGARIIDDSYNANPMSVTAALEALAVGSAERRIAVLGVMAELGDEHAAEHERMTGLARERGIEVIAVGTPDYGPDAAHVADIDEAIDRLGPIGAGDAVLVKGSRVAGLERLAARLLD
ncbi:MAG: UDP-N-acetylmuramoyl-tripeptide--D-alanyl-D-alanine ligase [Actinomycetota bacterium]